MGEDKCTAGTGWDESCCSATAQTMLLVTDWARPYNMTLLIEVSHLTISGSLLSEWSQAACQNFWKASGVS